MKVIRETTKPIFITGKAGTGKTTLLHSLKSELSMNFIVTAPTSVAALNAGGTTLHSFFQIPFGPLVPSEGESIDTLRFNPEKLSIMRKLEVLIIDEISMVRADVIDYLDCLLKAVKSNTLLFGGVRLILVGDLYQLPPVTKNEWNLLSSYYKEPYFFESYAIKKRLPVVIELQTVHRQKDLVFVELLGALRDNTITDEQLAILNERHVPYDMGQTDGYVTVTTHNYRVDQLNREKLAALPGETYQYKASVSGDFSSDVFPVDDLISLKVGAQIIMVKNDSSGDNQYFNGRAAKVINLTDTNIRVRFLSDGTEFDLVQEVWQNVKYSADEQLGRITESNSGSFTQYPIKLGWAITVHKSQGLTYEKAIIEVSNSFTHGQAYVALSRCRTLSGLILNSPVVRSSIITDPTVVDFMNRTLPLSDQVPIDQLILEEQYLFIQDILDFAFVRRYWSNAYAYLQENLVVNEEMMALCLKLKNLISLELCDVADNFNRKEISVLDRTKPIISGHLIVDRLVRAASYFLPRLDVAIEGIFQIFDAVIRFELDISGFLPDLNGLLVLLTSRRKFFEAIGHKIFDIVRLRSLVTENISTFQALKRPAKDRKQIDVLNPELYQALANWRKSRSREKGVPEYILLSERSLALIANRLPKTVEQLAGIPGIGHAKAKDIAPAVLEEINRFFGTNELF